MEMIRLKGRDVVDEAVWEGESPLDSRATFYLVKNGQKQQVPSELIPAMIALDGEDPENFLCEIPCVWDVLPLDKENVSVSFFLSEEVVIVQNPAFGGELGAGVRGFAVRRPIFEQASRWAKATPILSVENALDEFMNKLFPRIILRKGGWQSDPDLLRNAGSLSRALAQLFMLDLQDIRMEVEQSNPSLSPAIHGALLFDLTLDKIREIFLSSELSGNKRSPSGYRLEKVSLQQ